MMRVLIQQDRLAKAKDFDLQALGEIYDQYSPSLYAYALRLLGEPELAEDCLAETFSRFLQALKAGKGPQEYLQAYLYRIAHNWITDHYRRRPPPPLSLDGDLEQAGEANTEKEAHSRVLQAEVRAALYRLTPEQRQVVMLKYYEGLENEAVASALQKPVGAVKSLQHRALDALRRMLASGEEQGAAYESLR
jgi:RNA polymerase sigma-70 factor (ECF subfamily)